MDLIQDNFYRPEFRGQYIDYPYPVRPYATPESDLEKYLMRLIQEVDLVKENYKKNLIDAHNEIDSLKRELDEVREEMGTINERFRITQNALNRLAISSDSLKKPY